MKYKGFKRGLWTGILDHQDNQICNGDEIIDLTTNIAYTVKAQEQTKNIINKCRDYCQTLNIKQQ